MRPDNDINDLAVSPPTAPPAAEEGVVPPAAEAADDGLQSLVVRLRPEDIALLQGQAAREGADPSALAALWIEETADAIRQRQAR